MQQVASTRIRPIVAVRAMRALMRNREDTTQVFLLMEALRGKTTLRQLARLRQTENGQRMLTDRRSLLARLNDRASLAGLPVGTLGRAYYEFMIEEDLSAQGLAELSKVQKPMQTDEIQWFRDRNREMHDLLHVTAGYGRDPLGEACVVAFSFAQTGQKGFAVIAAVASFRLARRLRDPSVVRAVFEAYRQGRRAKWVIAADWESLLAQPLDAVRAQLNISPTKRYPRLLPNMRMALAAAQAAQASAL